MIKIKNIKTLSSISLDFLLVQFSIEDTEEDLSNYEFNIYRSNSPRSEFIKVANNIRTFEFKDYSANLSVYAPRHYYKVEAVNIITRETLQTEPYLALFNHTPDHVAFAVKEQYQMYLENILNNPDIYIFLRKRFGQKCHVCWDDIRLQSKSDSCVACYNTGYSGGYFAPIQIKYCAMSPEGSIQTSEDIFDAGERQSPRQIWINNYPLVYPGDIIMDNNNHRYRIVQVQQTSKSGFILRQILVIERLPLSDIAYKLFI